MTQKRRLRFGAAKHPLFARIVRDGIVVLPHIRNLTTGVADVKRDLSGWLAPHPANLAMASDSFLGQLLGMASGYRHLDLEVCEAARVDLHLASHRAHGRSLPRLQLTAAARHWPSLP